MSNYTEIRLNELKTKRYNLIEQRKRNSIEIFRIDKEIARIKREKEELKPFWKREEFWLQLIILSILVIGICIGGFYSGPTGLYW